MKKKHNDKQVKKILQKINVMILGSGQPKTELNRRKKINKALKKAGLNTFIMEEQGQPRRQITQVDKFVELLEKRNLLCITIITKNGKTEGVTFEVGYMCGHHGRTKNGKKRLADELGFLIESGVNEKAVLTSYIDKGIFLDSIKMRHEFSTIKDIVKYTESWVKNRAEELGLL